MNLKTILTVTITALITLAMFYFLSSYTTVENTSGRMLWKQSVEQQLKERTDQYHSEMYDRYSRMERDLNNYQKGVNRRFDYLEDRLENQGLIINNTNNQINN